MTSAVPDEKRMKLRYAGTCRICRAPVEARAEAIYERSYKTVRCLDCPEPNVSAHEVPRPMVSKQQPPRHEAAGQETTAARATGHEAADSHDAPAAGPVAAVEAGTPGASARREFERRRATREDRIRTKHPRLGGVILALTDDPQSTEAWDTGAVGEEKLGARLNACASDSCRVLHDRTVPRSRANIDHLAVTAAGVFVIDAKRYTGRPHLKIEGGLLRPRVEKLLVGARDRTRLVDSMVGQVDLVRGIVGDSMPVHGVLCFVDADWPLLGGSFVTREVRVVWPRRLLRDLSAEGPHGNDEVAAVHATLAAALAPA